MRQKSLVLILLSSGLLLTGCAAPKLMVNLKTGAELNQNEQGESLPVLVRIYLLRQAQKFTDADFNTLWKSDEATLGGDIVVREEVTLFPDSNYVFEFERVKKSGAAYLAVVGIFRKPTEDCWRQLIETKTIKKRVALRLSGQCIEIAPVEKPRPKFRVEEDTGL